MAKRFGDFTPNTILQLQLRAASHCQNPACRAPTQEFSPNRERVVLGEAAHIRGPQENSARHEPSWSEEQFKSVDNGIWLCRRCHKKIDDTKSREDYPASKLEEWLNLHCTWINREILVSRPPRLGLTSSIGRPTSAIPAARIAKEDLEPYRWHKFRITNDLSHELKNLRGLIFPLETVRQARSNPSAPKQVQFECEMQEFAVAIEGSATVDLPPPQPTGRICLSIDELLPSEWAEIEIITVINTDRWTTIGPHRALQSGMKFFPAAADGTIAFSALALEAFTNHMGQMKKWRFEMRAEYNANTRLMRATGSGFIDERKLPAGLDLLTFW